MLSKVFVGLALLLALSSAGVEAKSEEIKDSKEFNKLVKDSKDVWAVLFYAPWCGHCQALFPEWNKFAKAVSPSIRVAQVDADSAKDLGGRYQVQGFPTIKFFAGDKNKPQDYQGQRTAAAMAQHSLKTLNDVVQERLGGKKSSSSGGGQKFQGSGGGKERAIMLTTSDFQDKVLSSSEDWLVQFMAPWCGHCQKLKPEWEDAAKQLHGEFKLGVVDATAESSLAQQYGVQGYPTIKLFSTKDGKKVPSDYNGGRTASDIVNYVNNHLEATGATKPITELATKTAFSEECSEEWHGICVIAFLPHILDDQSKLRNMRLEKLSAAKKKVGRTFKFMWLQGGENFEMEEKLGLGFGYPALVAISPSKRRFAVMKSSFETDNIESFLNGVLRGKQGTSEVKGWPLKFVKYPPWDGKDAALPDEDLD